MNNVNLNEERLVDTKIEEVESWLDAHPRFVHDYFVRKASLQMVDSWILFHSFPQDLVHENTNLSNTSSSAVTQARKTSFQELERKTGFSRCFCSQLFDPSRGSSIKEMQGREEICIPWGNMGHVAEYRESLNMPDCYEIRDISILNAELYESFKLENKRNQVLLDLARMVFEEQSTIGQILQRIMIHIVSFLQVERCQVLLLDENTKTVNIPDVLQDNRFDQSVDKDRNFRHHSILCMPIRNASKNIVGVSQIINKLSGKPFTKKDVNIFEVFATLCGLGIQHAQLHERAMKAVAKTKVILEVMSYHATAPLEEVQELLRVYHIPSTQTCKLYDLKFDYFSLNDKEMLKACLRMFMDMGFIQRFRIEYDVSKLGHMLGELESLSLLLACLSHDLDHRGTTNSFLKKSNSPLAQLYSTSIMEHHHFDQCVMLLNSEGNQILSHLSTEEYMTVVHVLEDAILATDLTVHYKAMLMTACDIAGITKPWKIQRKIAVLIANEFFEQGDVEKQLKLEPTDMMNRDKKDKLPLMQVAFIDSICLPLYEAFAMISDKLGPLLEDVKENRAQWLKLAEEKRTLF
ncbi:dual 3',5'-cyclic-AMP and -GMP phosphodiesterase 11 [Caerostris darwini]|uniref:Phosphodiesterase n=1 Tax=Caerostris darwini TaxID=1538125 RepID=A0AAV4T5H4_9ARAC|nr:dual 3',5'-cyclic-AMP and -GMP phosphodiesterase 11 [Caerostris darwini]